MTESLDGGSNALLRFWKKAADDLGLEVTAPFRFSVNGRQHECIAHVARFSGPNGIVIFAYVPGHELDRQLLLDLKQSGFGWSFMNVGEYKSYDAMLAKDTLKEWGFVGDEEGRPDWLQ